MSLENAVNFAKRANEEKMGYRFQFPLSLKEEFETVCQNNGVSMTDMILGLISSAIDESKGLSDITSLCIINKIEVLKEKVGDLIYLRNESNKDVVTTTDGRDVYVSDDIESLNIQIKALERELINRSKS